MTPEQKAKAYDEALEKAKQIIVEYDYDEHNNVFMEIFHELKESEDEKVRKWLISQLKIKSDDTNSDLNIMINKAISWLEKQDEHAKFRDSIQVGDNVTRNENGVLVNLSRLNRVAKKDEKQGEQKPADKVEPKFKVGDVMRTLQEAANNITSGLPVVVSIDEEYYHCTNELIAIKDQDDYEYPPMNRAIAWSEEDEEFLRRAINATKDIYPMTANWLKSLKDRFTWKPSEEQIECLHDAINHYQTNGYPASKLNELYEQMSKIYKL